MRKFLRLSLLATICGSLVFFPACSPNSTPEPTQPTLTQTLSSDATDATAIATAQEWFARIKQTNTISIDWTQARTAGNWVVAPFLDAINPFAQSPHQGYRYLIVQIHRNKAYDGRIVEVVLPTKKLSTDQAAASATEGIQPLIVGASPSRLGTFTGCILVYSSTYVYQTGVLYENGTAHSEPVRLRVQRDAAEATSKKSTLNQIDDPNSGSITNLIQVCEVITVVVSSDGKVYGGYTTRTCTTVDDSNNGPGSGGWGGTSPSNPGGGSVSTSAPLVDQLNYNNTALIGPCPGLTDAWRPLINYVAPGIAIDRLHNLSANEKSVLGMYGMNEPYYMPDYWVIQSIANAQGIAINLDYFSVKINKLPDGFNSPDMLLEYIRTNINNFIDTQYSSFQPHPGLSGETNRWLNDPLGSILSITIPVDNGSVIVSGYNHNYWIFSTIRLVKS